MSVNIRETNLSFGDLQKRNTTDAIVIHHVGDPDRDVSAEEIHKWHRANGWSGIGYHYVVRKAGGIDRGRPEWALGAHCQGDNYHTIGVNIVGNLSVSKPTPEQIESAAMLIADIAKRYGYTPERMIDVLGHRDFMPTDCPGDNLYPLISTIRGKAIYYMQQGV